MCEIICYKCQNEIDEEGGLCDLCASDLEAERDELDYKLNHTGKMECGVHNCAFNNFEGYCKRADSIEFSDEFTNEGYPILKCERYLKKIKSHCHT
jgi:hypothetical protein